MFLHSNIYFNNANIFANAYVFAVILQNVCNDVSKSRLPIIYHHSFPFVCSQKFSIYILSFNLWKNVAHKSDDVIFTHPINNFITEIVQELFCCCSELVWIKSLVKLFFLHKWYKTAMTLFTIIHYRNMKSGLLRELSVTNIMSPFIDSEE